MGTMTICRSKTLLAACVVAIPFTLSAQTPPPIRQPQNAARNAANASSAQTNAQQAEQQPQQPQSSAQREGRVVIESGAVPTQNPSTHIVQQGETLWALAQQFLGDPLLWPEIYRLNTDVVEDPHWIYPGEELRLAPAPVTTEPVVVNQNVTVTPRDTMPVAPQRWSTQGPTIFNQQTVAAQQVADLELNERNAYRAVREGEYFSSGFLTENQPLGSGRVLTNLETSTLGNIRTRESASQFEDVAVELPPGQSLQVGDLLLVFRRSGETDRYGEIIRPTGLLRYAGPAGDRHRATVLRQFGQIADGQELLRVQPFAYNSNVRAQPVTGGLEGWLITQRDPREIMVLQDVIFIDKGANDGVRLGDVFQVYRVTEPDQHGVTVEQDQARALVVNTRDRTSTAVIIEVYRGDGGLGSRVRQIRRMPS